MKGDTRRQCCSVGSFCLHFPGSWAGIKVTGLVWPTFCLLSHLASPTFSFGKPNQTVPVKKIHNLSQGGPRKMLN